MSDLKFGDYTLDQLRNHLATSHISTYYEHDEQIVKDLFAAAEELQQVKVELSVFSNAAKRFENEQTYGGLQPAEIREWSERTFSSYRQKIISDLISAAEDGAKCFKQLQIVEALNQQKADENEQLRADLEGERKAHTEVVRDTEQLRADLEDMHKQRFNAITANEWCHKEIERLKLEVATVAANCNRLNDERNAAQADLSTLVSQVELLRADLARVNAENEQLRADPLEWQTIGADKATQQEIVKLRVDKERLREALKEIISTEDYLSLQSYGLGDISRCALEET